MKIALIILHADPAKGGAETYTVDLARALADRGHQVALLAASFAQGLDPRIALVPLPYSGPTRLSRYLCFLNALDRRLDSTTYDVTHAMLPVRRCDLYHPHAGLAAEAVIAGHAKHGSPVRRAMSRFANRVNRKRQRFAAIERELLTRESGRSAPVVICLSDYIKATVRRHFELPDEKLATLINAVDLRKFDPAASTAREAFRAERGIGVGQVMALMVAQDFARKGLREAVLAWKLIADERLVLLVVGKDDFRPYAKLAEGALFPRNLMFAGATRDVRPFYSAADFFVLPTRHDPCSLVVLEALAMGLPVISTRFNGACEVMTEGEHGFVLGDPADVPALAIAMRRMLDAAARAKMHDACIALRPRLAYEHHLDELMELYRSIRSSGTRGLGRGPEEAGLKEEG